MLKNYKKIRNKIVKFKKIKFVNNDFLSYIRFLDAMKKIYGINYYVSYTVLKLFGYSNNIKLEFIKNIHLNFLTDFFLTYLLVERGLKKYRSILYEERKQIGHVSGYRLFKGLPVHGQRTHSNSKTVRRLFKNK